VRINPLKTKNRVTPTWPAPIKFQARELSGSKKLNSGRIWYSKIHHAPRARMPVKELIMGGLLRVTTFLGVTAVIA
jgi:hypothetical protein